MKRSGPIRRTAMKRTQPKPDQAWQEVRQRVIARAGGFCEGRVTTACLYRGNHVHHKLRRGQGGQDVEENLVLLCAVCHDHIHGHPEESYENGFLVRVGTIEQ